MTIRENYHHLGDEIARLAQKYGRKSSDITLVAVSKNQTVDDISTLYHCGCRNFGESRIPEALSKQPQLPTDILWHFIGTLQKNKAQKAVGKFTLIHSVDTPELARKIAQNSLQIQTTTPILLQVNTSGEPSKHGLDPEAWRRAIEPLLQLPGIRIEGFMTMAPYVNDEKILRHCFASLRLFRDQVAAKYSFPLPHLSMGMSNDFPFAIAEGATLLRIGNTIFNPK